MRQMTIKEKSLYAIWWICKILTKPFYIIGNLAVDKLNKNYYATHQASPDRQADKEEA